MEKGYIKLSRSFFDNKMWQAARTFSESEAWLDLIQSARFEASPITSCIGCYEVTWGRGQYPASNRFLAKKWGRSEQWVKTFLGKLKREKMVTTDNSQGLNVITLVNYEKYNVNTSEKPSGNSMDNPPNNPFNQLSINELRALITHLITHPMDLQPTSNPNNKKGEEREEKKKRIPKGIPKEKRNFLGFDLSFIDRDEYFGIMCQWLEYKREIKKQYKSCKTVKVCYDRLVKLSGGDADVAEAIVEQSIGNGYQGLFPLKRMSKPFATGSLKDRQKALWNGIINCGVQCPADTQKAFYAKWSETDATGQWMKCELENGFDIKRRLERYVINSQR